MSRATRWVALLVSVLLVAATSAVGPASGAGAAVSNDECFVRESHSVFLGRQPSGAEISWWKAVVAGGSRSQLPEALADSDEWLGVEVDKLYLAALDRTPDPGGRNYWIGRLAAGALVNEIGASIYGSNEFYVGAGGTPVGFITDLYDRILGRSPDGGGLAYWQAQLAARGRGGVAASFFGSVESRTQRVTALYGQVLGRAPEPGGQSYWVGRLASVNDVRLAVLLASSAEFYSRSKTVGACAPLVRITAGNSWSKGASVSGRGELVAFDSLASNLTPGDANGVSDVFAWVNAADDSSRLTGGNGPSYAPSLSADGSTVAFDSSAANLVPGDANGVSDVFVIDSEMEISRITNGNGASTNAVVSRDGSVVVFQSDASNLVPGDVNSSRDVFLRDRASGVTTRITNGNSASYTGSVSDDGNTVVFSSLASNLVPGDSNGETDVFLWNRTSGVTTLITGGNDYSTTPSVSGDGTTVVFHSAASDLVAGDGNGTIDVFVWARSSGLISRVTNGNAASYSASISRYGTTVAFHSDASNLVPGDANGAKDVFVWDRGSGGISRLTAGDGSSFDPKVSADGSTVVFTSEASNLVPGDVNGYWDVFVRGTAG